MQLRWTEDAANDLERITDYLFEHAPERAAKLVHTIYDAPTALLAFPLRGRPGKKQGTRELVLSPLPYIAGLYRARRPDFYNPYSPRRAAVAVNFNSKLDPYGTVQPGFVALLL